MSILSIDDYIAAKKQRCIFNKTASITGVAANQSMIIHCAGNPGAGTLAVGNTANGIVPTDLTAGFPIINAFDGGAKGYLSNLEVWSPVAGDLTIYDMLFAAGAYSYNADTTLASQPSYSGRVPGGTDFSNTELWLGAVTAFTGNQTCQINYLDQGGSAGDTGAVATGVAPIIGRMFRMPLASGDSGISQITRVRSSVSTVGTFNVYVLRPLCRVRIPIANGLVKLDLTGTGMPEVFDTSALIMLPTMDSTATSTPWAGIEVANK